MNREKFTIMFGLLVFVLILSACGVSKKEYLASQDQVKLLVQDKESLSDKITSLEQENMELRATTENIKNEQSMKISELTQEKQEKEKKIAELQKTYDQLTTELKEEVKMGEVKVTKLRDKLSVNMVEKILFNSGEAKIKKQGLDILSRVGEILKQVEDKGIRIEGHTDNIPIGAGLKDKYPSNWHLSAARAINVALYLEHNVGLSPDNLSVAGYSSYRPIADNTTIEGRSQNRRIEIVLVPLDIERLVPEEDGE
ncbi:MAG: OmpA family protein [bacterium]